MTANDYLAACRSSGMFTEADCQQRVREQTVNGAFCDGNIVMDLSGKRCVPRAVVEAKVKAEIIPPQKKPPTTIPTWGLVAGGLVVAVVVAYAVCRR